MVVDVNRVRNDAQLDEEPDMINYLALNHEVTKTYKRSDD